MCVRFQSHDVSGHEHRPRSQVRWPLFREKLTCGLIQWSPSRKIQNGVGAHQRALERGRPDTAGHVLREGQGRAQQMWAVRGPMAAKLCGQVGRDEGEPGEGSGVRGLVMPGS